MNTVNTHHLFVKTIIFAALLCFALPITASASEPLVRGLVLFEVENDTAFDSEDPKEEVSNTFTTIEPFLIAPLTDNLALETSLNLKRLKKKNNGTDQFFDDHSLFFEELKLTYFGDNYSLFAGKYNPTFGIAWDLAKGIVGKDFAKDYELRERIGAGGSYFFDDPMGGFQVLTANTFFLDTTFLSGSLNGNRDIVDLDDGGASNTESLSSYSVTLEGENTLGFKNFNTYLGYSHQAAGDADSDARDENGYAVGASYKFKINKKTSVTALGEWAGIYNFGGDADVNQHYITGSLVTKYNKNWNLTLARTDRIINNQGKKNKADYQLQASAGYVFENGFSIDAGYRQTEKSGTLTRGAVSLLAYTYEF